MNLNSKHNFYTHLAQTSDEPIGLHIKKAEGCYLETWSGERYLDFISGIAVSSLGHRHPKVINAIKQQIDRHLHVMVYGEYIQDVQAEFVGLLTSQLPVNLDRVYLVNSGTEANEGALKLAKKFTGRTHFLAFRNSYHGDTHGSLSVTGRDVYRNSFLPLLPDIHFADFNSDNALTMINPDLAAVILEPIQGEGGIIPARKEWLVAIRRLCDEQGVLLIFDEIQSGFGRTGHLFAFQYYEVVPDILCMAKAMGGGMPIGGFASSSEIFNVFKNDPPLNHVTTFGGHPVSAAAALANLEELLRGDYLSKAKMIEKRIKQELNHKLVREIRGIGAMLGMELINEEITAQFVQDCFKNGVILGWTLHSNTLVRLAPPLIIDDLTLSKAIAVMKTQLDNLL